MPSPKVISAENLSCTRGDNQLFKCVNFNVNEGECLHITGPNGCGKTSLLRIISGINLVEGGSLTWSGANTNNNSQFYSECAYIAHKEGLKSELTAIENLRYYQHLDAVKNELALDDALDQMGILKCADLSTQQLSFGQRRRLSFARLLMTNYPLWVLDEPFTGIDAAGLELIESLCVDHLKGGGLIIMTHHQTLVNSPLNQYRSELKLGQT